MDIQKDKKNILRIYHIKSIHRIASIHGRSLMVSCMCAILQQQVAVKPSFAEQQPQSHTHSHTGRNTCWEGSMPDSQIKAKICAVTRQLTRQHHRDEFLQFIVRVCVLFCSLPFPAPGVRPTPVSRATGLCAMPTMISDRLFPNQIGTKELHLSF